MSQQTASLEVRNLTRTFGDKTAVDDVTFTVEPGKMTGFVGANGAGKTTTMRMIMGVLVVHGGEVLWDGRPITAADRARFGYMPEERGLYPKQGILDQLTYLGQLRGMTRKDAAREATRMLERFGLGDRLKDKLESLSLGNQQRVQITASLLHAPTALVLDEPFSGLDPVAVDSMVDLLRDRLREGVPVLFSSHQLDLVERLCDSLVVLSDGKIMAAGTREELKSRGPRRYRVATPPDAGWLRDEPGVRVVDVDGAHAVLELEGEGTQARLLERAVPRGLTEFTPLVPSLTDIYREVTR
ncbi:ABC transporter ATP-binding protein [Sanguibacter suaedae]|uniref:ATP-binding cassette domain-containing protein n=1 Tax=Sanguibacter suaedae TaxID=2795737 RepID=A0A934IDC1_9MICO|nr:ATP-binding cassette domain-containing protein [Sanguibacter suaedae]MBI9115665.1 ATP-binding cassette domain-containing protein [Sanguibacter suaedae]